MCDANCKVDECADCGAALFFNMHKLEFRVYGDDKERVVYMFFTDHLCLTCAVGKKLMSFKVIT